MFTHLILSSRVSRLAIERGKEQDSTYHSKLITNIEYREDQSTPCFEIALDELPNFPEKGWIIDMARSDMPDEGAELRLVTAKSDEQNVAGVHAHFGWVRHAGGLFVIVNNGRGMSCTISGEHIFVLG